MKNNEILVSVRFEKDTNYREMSFLVIKDITFKALIEAIYFGLKKHTNQVEFIISIQNLKKRTENIRQGNILIVMNIAE